MSAIDKIIAALDKYDQSILDVRFQIGDLIHEVQKEERYKRVSMAITYVENEVSAKRGVPPSFSYLQVCHEWAATWPAGKQRQQIIQHGWNANFVTWACGRSARDTIIQEALDGTRRPVIPAKKHRQIQTDSDNLDNVVRVQVRNEHGDLDEEAALNGVCSVISRFDNGTRAYLVEETRRRLGL